MNFLDDEQAVEDLRQALGSGRPERIAHAAMTNIWPLYANHSDFLIAAIEGLPSTVLARFPVLRAAHRLTPVLANTSRPFKPLMDPETVRTMSADELDVMTLAQMVTFRYSGDVSAALVYARRLHERIAHTPLESREGIDGPLWFYHFELGSTFLAAGDSSRSLVELATARHLGSLSKQDYAERIVLSTIALAHAVRGSLEEAGRALDLLNEHPPVEGPLGAAGASTERAASALIAVERMSDDLDGVLASLESYDSLDLSWPFALLARTRALLARHRPDEALESVRLARDSHPTQHGSFAADVIGSATIEAYAAGGDVAHARQHAEARDHGGVLTRLAIARLALEDARYDRAAIATRAVLADPTIGPGLRMEAQLLGNWAAVAETDELDAVSARRIVRLATRGNGKRLLATLPSRVTSLARAEIASDAEAAAFDAALSGFAAIDLQHRPNLTAGEMRVLTLLPHNPTTRQIAEELHLSPNTVKTQLTSLYRKLGCSTRADAMRIATRFQLLVPVD